MLTPEQIAALRDAAGQIVDPIAEYLLSDIARRISEAGQLTSTAAYEVWRAQNLGLSQREIKKRLEKLLACSADEIETLMTQSAEVGYNFDISNLPTADAIPFAQNQSLQQIVAAAVALAQDDFTNLTQTLGMVDPFGRALPLQDVYRSCTDFAFKQVFTGTADYNTAIRQATANLAKYGLRTIDYESGVHTSMEAAVRRNIMGGIGLMQEQIAQYDHDISGADGWEISAHANSAPDHEPIQGKQYTDTEYTVLNNSLKRRIGTLNCGHAAFPIILGVNSPQYTPTELRKFREDNETGVTYEGKHYTGYEATQQQRRIERAIRAQKRRVLVAEGTGDADHLLTAQMRLTCLNAEYRRFSDTVGLRTEAERAQVAGFGKGHTARANAASRKEVAKYSAVHYNQDGTIVVTDDWKSKGKVSPPRKLRPNAVLETQTKYKNGTVQIDRTLYDRNGIMRTQIHSGPHNRPDLHQFGKFGEHAHDYTWNDDGSRKERIDRELNSSERKKHADILRKEEENE